MGGIAMDQSEKTNEDLNRQVAVRLGELEQRVQRLEADLGLIWRRGDAGTVDDITMVGDMADQDEVLESRFGEQGMAWMGNLVLLTGITLLFEFLINTGFELLGFLFGLVAVAGLYMGSRLLSRTYETMAYLFNVNVYLIAYYLTIRMHFFQVDPLTENATLVVLLAIAIVAVMTFFGTRHANRLLSGLALILLAFSALLSDSTHILLLLLVVCAGLSTFMLFRFRWWNVFFLGLILVYTSFLLWLVGNPLAGHSLGMLPFHNYGIVYLFIIGGIFSQAAILPRLEENKESTIIISLIINAFAFSMLTTLFVLSFYRNDYPLLN